MTSREAFQNIIDALQKGNFTDLDPSKLISWCQTQIEKIDKIAEKSKVKLFLDDEKKQKSEYGEALEEVLLSYLTNKPQTVEEIADTLKRDGIISPLGRPFSKMWISKMAEELDYIGKTHVQVEKITRQGEKNIKVCKGYYIKGD